MNNFIFGCFEMIPFGATNGPNLITANSPAGALHVYQQSIHSIETQVTLFNFIVDVHEQLERNTDTVALHTLSWDCY